MTFKFNHFNFNVTDLERSKAFYRDALGLEESHRIEADDGSYVIVYLSDGKLPRSLQKTSGSRLRMFCKRRNGNLFYRRS